MASMLSGAVINIILDPVFIFGLQWGMTGAALATIIGQCVSFVISLIYFFRTKTFKLSKKSFVPDFKAFSGALKLGMSLFIMEMYGDSAEEARKNIRRSDEARAAYYSNISGKSWGDRHNYHLMIDSSVGAESSAKAICDYIASRPEE